jgi:hypothetical protein
LVLLKRDINNNLPENEKADKFIIFVEYRQIVKLLNFDKKLDNFPIRFRINNRKKKNHKFDF